MRAIREHIKPAEGHSFKCFHFSLPRFQCPYHYHPEVELTLIDRGRGQRLVGDHLASFEPGDLILMGADLPHSYFHPPDYDEGPKGAASIVLQFLPDVAGNILGETPECREVRRLLARSRRGLVFGGKTRERVSAALRTLQKSDKLPRLILFMEILHALSLDRGARPLASEGFRPVFNRHQAGRIERVCAWVTENFREPLTLDQAAREAHLTPAAFSRFFHRATNRPFVRFLNELRVGHACRLLLETEQPIAEIAFGSGFENLSNFNRRFRDLKGTTPRAYRAAALS